MMKTKTIKSQLLAVALLFSVSIARAQNAPPANAPGSGVLQTPPDVSTLVSIDAHNIVIIGTRDSQLPNAPREYSLAAPRHIYSGAIARIFGGTIVSTEALVIPESALRSNMGFRGGVTAFGASGNSGGQNGGNGNFGGGNFGGQNQGNGNSGALNRGFSTYAPRVPIQNLQQFNQLLSILDRPLRQAETGVSQ